MDADVSTAVERGHRDLLLWKVPVRCCGKQGSKHVAAVGPALDAVEPAAVTTILDMDVSYYQCCFTTCAWAMPVPAAQYGRFGNFRQPTKTPRSFPVPSFITHVGTHGHEIIHDAA